MKKTLFGLILIGIFFLLSFPLLAQDPPPPPGGGHGQGGNQTPGGSAPVGSGLVVMIALGAAYGSKKIYDARKRFL
jgi:hypothetical protein